MGTAVSRQYPVDYDAPHRRAYRNTMWQKYDFHMIVNYKFCMYASNVGKQK